jgi:hypothetical protein
MPTELRRIMQQDWQVSGTSWLQEGKLFDDCPDNDEGADYLVNVDANDGPVALCYDDDIAKLVVAAPKLRDALKPFAGLELAEWSESGGQWWDGSRFHDLPRSFVQLLMPAIKAARAALNEAAIGV